MQMFSLAFWRRTLGATSRVKEHNMTGEGTILGGQMVVRAGAGGVAYAHKEAAFGDYGPMDDLLAAARREAGKQ